MNVGKYGEMELNNTKKVICISIRIIEFLNTLIMNLEDSLSERMMKEYE